MTSKVFLFNDDKWLYCDNVRYDDEDNLRAHVINGVWNFIFSKRDGKNFIYICDVHQYIPAELKWACDPSGQSLDYNQIIENARERYLGGESGDFVLKQVIREPDEKGIPF